MLTTAPAHAPDRKTEKLERQEIILRAAARVFSEKGYDAATTREIAQATGLSKSGFYHHVPAKQDLLFQIMDRYITRFLEAGRQGSALELPADAKMRLMIERHVAMLVEWLDEGRVHHESRRALNPAQLAAYMAKRDAYVSVFVQIVQEGIVAGQFRPSNLFLTSHTILDILNGLLRWYSPPGPPTVEEITAHVRELIVDRMLR